MSLHAAAAAAASASYSLLLVPLYLHAFVPYLFFNYLIISLVISLYACGYTYR